MKKEELTALGLEQDVIDKIFAMNGKDLAAEKAKLSKVEGERDNYRAQLDTAKETLAKFDGVNVEDLKGQITKLQADIKAKDDAYAAKESERQFSESVKAAITSAGGRNAKAIMSLLDTETLRQSKNQSEDIKTAIEAVKESDSYLFGATEPHSNPVGKTGGNSGNTDGEFATMRALMGLPAEKK